MTAKAKINDGTAEFFRTRPAVETFTDFNDICEFDKNTWEVLKDLPIRTGSLLRVPSEYYEYWRIRITEENRQQLIDEHNRFREQDYQERERDTDISGREKTSLSISMRDSMTRFMAVITKELMQASDDGKREFNILDLATGAGQTVSAIASALWIDLTTRELLERTSFHLVDYSGRKLDRAEEELRSYGPNRIEVYKKRDDIFLDITPERFDIVLSLCHFHKKPFLQDTLERVYKVLAKKGVLISGDWHSTLCNHPIYILQLLERMGIDAWRVNLFRDLFNEFLDPTSYPNMSYEEIRAVADHQDYWAELSYDIYADGVMPMKSRHYVLGAFDTTKKRVEKLEHVGLVTDPDTIRKAFKNARLPNNPQKMICGSDRASVIMAMKKGAK